MAAELQPPDNTVPSTAAAAATVAPPPSGENPPLPMAPKRQRRPSVRLGEIGDQPATLRTKNTSWSLSQPRIAISKPSKTRPITNLVNGHHLDESERPTKSKRGISTKRVRSNWVGRTSEVIQGDTNVNDNVNGNDGVDGGGDNGNGNECEDVDVGYPESPVNSVDNVEADVWNGRQEGNDEVEYGDFPEPNLRGSTDRVRAWLIELGMSRYAPVFEIHEVDDEVLPLLTLEDLKDMGISAVGSRRKMYTAIQKLRRGGATPE